jgi:hypothetical protein
MQQAACQGWVENGTAFDMLIVVLIWREHRGLGERNNTPEPGTVELARFPSARAGHRLWYFSTW